MQRGSVRHNRNKWEEGLVDEGRGVGSTEKKKKPHLKLESCFIWQEFLGLQAQSSISTDPERTALQRYGEKRGQVLWKFYSKGLAV